MSEEGREGGRKWRGLRNNTIIHKRRRKGDDKRDKEIRNWAEENHGSIGKVRLIEKYVMVMRRDMRERRQV